jgi:Ribbon-helix-helix domain
MAKRPAFDALKKTKPMSGEAAPAEVRPAAVKPQADTRIQTSVRLEPAMWAALNDLATRKRVEAGRRVTVHDLLIDGVRHVLAVNGIKLSE